MITNRWRKLGGRLFATLLLMNMAFPGLFAQYQLTGGDVEMDGGTIIQYKRSGISRIIIPNEIDDILVTGIASSSTTGVFEGKGITEITLPSGLENIGTKAFYNNALTSLTIPQNVKSIGAEAFAENSIQNLSIPQNVETISADAFRSNELNTVDIKDDSKLRYIGKYAFGFNNLPHIVMPTSYYGSYNWKSSNGYQYAAKEAFNDFTRSYTLQVPGILNPDDLTINSSGIIIDYHRDDLTIVIIPEEINGITVKGIADRSPGIFASKGIETLELPSTIESIGEKAFRENPIKSLVLPENLKTIGDEAFYTCYLEALVIPASVETIGENAFHSNPLTEMKFEANSMLLSIERNAFYNTLLTQIQLPTSAQKLLVDWSGSENLKPGDFITDFDWTYTARFATVLTDSDVTMDGKGRILSCTAKTPTGHLYIPEKLDGQTVTGIADAMNDQSGVFCGKGIKQIFFPSTMEYIGDYAFYKVVFEKFELPVGIKHIGDYAYYYSYLNELTLPTGIEVIGKSAFQNNDIESLVLPASLKTIGKCCFAGNKINSLDFEKDITLSVIPDEAFLNNQLAHLQLPASITHIGASAFKSNVITGTNLNEGLKEIGSKAFQQNLISSVNLPSTLTSIGSYSFNENKIRNLDLPGNITMIAEHAFDSNDITTLNLSTGMADISESSFANNKITALTIPTNIINIGISAFENNALSSVTFEPNSGIKNIYENAFYGNDFAGIVLPISKYSDCYGWYNEEASYLEGETIRDFSKSYRWITLYTLKDDELILNADGYIQNCLYNFDNKHIVIPSMVNGTAILGIIDASSGVFSSKDIAMLFLPEGIEHIGNMAFAGNNIRRLTIPSSVETIGDRAFKGCHLLETLTFIENCKLKYIGIEAFADNDKLSGLKLPQVDIENYLGGWRDSNGKRYEELTVIEDYKPAYFARYHYKLTSADASVNETGELTRSYYAKLPSVDIIIPEELNGKTVKSIGFGSYLRDKELASVVLPPTIESIAGLSGNNLTEITIPGSVKDIKRGAFLDNQIKNLSIPASVRSIGASAFKDNALSSVSIEDNSALELIEEFAFAGNESLTGITLPYSSVPDYTGWIASNNMDYETGDLITEFDKVVYCMARPYTLQSGDVVLNADGVIQSCSVDFTYRRAIIIPDQINGITIKGIADNSQVFVNKEIQRITLPTGLEFIGNGTFAGCQLSSLHIPASVTSIGTTAFYNCWLKEVIIEEESQLEIINYRAFYQNDDLAGIQTPVFAKIGTDEYTAWINGEGTLHATGDMMVEFNTRYGLARPYSLQDADVEISTDGIISAVTFNERYNLITIPSVLQGIEVKSITSGFAYKEVLYVFLPESLERIDSGSNGYYTTYPFEGSWISKLKLPKKNDPAFMGWIRTTNSQLYTCDGYITDFGSTYKVTYQGTLTDNELTINEAGEITAYNPLEDYHYIMIPEVINGITVKGIGMEGDENTSLFKNRNLFNVILPATVTHIHKNAFMHNKLGKLDLPDVLEYIGESAFYNCGITSVNLPESLRYLGSQAFDGNELSTIAIPEGIESIENRAFSNNNLTSIQWSSNLKSIGSSAFESNQLSRIELPATLKTIGLSAFKNNQISSIEWAPELSEIPRFAFADNQLENLIIPGNIVSIAQGAFNDNILQRVQLTEMGKLKLITANAFERNYGLEEIILPESDYENFIGWYDGDYNKMEVNQGYSNFTKNLHIRLLYTLSADDITISPEGQLTIADYDNTIKDIIIPEVIDGIVIKELGSISHWTFYGDKLFTLKIPNTVEKIYKYCFTSNMLSEINLPDALTSLGQYAFLNNPATNVVLPIPAKEGYELAWWEASNGLRFNGAEVFNDHSLSYKAVFSPVSFIITYMDGEAIHTNPVLYTIETPTITLSAASKQGYNFVGWYDNEELSGEYLSEITQGSIGDIQLWPKWEVATGLDGEFSQGVSLYPNPVSNELTIRIPETIKARSIKIYNSNGQLLQLIDMWHDDTARVNLSTFAKGVYIVHIQLSEGAPIVKKIIKR